MSLITFFWGNINFDFELKMSETIIFCHNCNEWVVHYSTLFLNVILSRKIRGESPKPKGMTDLKGN